MKAAVNGRFMTRRLSGVERYAQEIMRFLGDRLEIVRPKLRLGGAAGHAWEQFVLPAKIRAGETLWSPANTGPLSVSNQVLTLQDLSPIEHPEWFKPIFSAWYRLFLPLLARRIKRILTPSETVRKRILARFSLPAERVITTSAGVDTARFHPGALPKEPYVLFVGTHEPRKNILTLLQAWERIKIRYPDYSLVVAGSAGNVFHPLSLPGKIEQVKFPGYIPEVDLPSLYAYAELFVLPSYDEGFGLPVLEAMACGTPVIAARAGALPEVLGEAGLYFDPADASALADAIESCLGDPHRLCTLRESGLERARQFSWQNSAEKVWQALESCP
jgi:glycosyltransferase involved in cell wall biosynthesis